MQHTLIVAGGTVLLLVVGVLWYWILLSVQAFTAGLAEREVGR